MDQFAALAFAQDLGKPLGGGNQAADFATAGRDRAWRMEFRMAMASSVSEAQHQRPSNCARRRQTAAPPAGDAEPQGNMGVEGVGLTHEWRRAPAI